MYSNSSFDKQPEVATIRSFDRDENLCMKLNPTYVQKTFSSDSYFPRNVRDVNQIRNHPLLYHQSPSLSRSVSVESDYIDKPN